MEDCIFCKIVKKEIPTEIVKETEDLMVFKDINPKAPIHLLIIPKTHLSDISGADDDLWLKIKATILELARINNLKGYRIGSNVGQAAIVKHMHVHFLGPVSAEREI